MRHKMLSRPFSRGPAIWRNTYGGPRTLTQVLKVIDLCPGRNDSQQAKLVEFLSKF